MRKPVVWVTSLMLAFLLLLGASEIYARFTAESRGTSAAASAAKALGFDLRNFKGPTISGGNLWGTESLFGKHLRRTVPQIALTCSCQTNGFAGPRPV